MNNFDKPPVKKIEDEEYKIYNENVYHVVVTAMEEFSQLSKTKKRKILRYKQLPAEAVFLFKNFEKQGININHVPDEQLKLALKEAFKLIDRDDEYDQDLMKNVGQMETLRWRIGEELKDDSSFQRIVAILKEHAVAETPKTKIGQNPKVKFTPRGDYHKKGSLK